MKPQAISQRKMNRILANTSIRVRDLDKVSESRKGYYVSFDPSPVIINIDTGDQVDYSGLTVDEYVREISTRETKTDNTEETE